jgi:hypothetical protein
MPKTKNKPANLEVKLPSKEAVFKKVVSEIKEESKSAMELQDAIHLIEGRESDERFEQARTTLENRLKKVKDPEEKATCYYYLLRLLLREHLLFETKEARDLYHEMWSNLMECEAAYRKRYTAKKDPTEKKIIRAQIIAFFQLADSYLNVLENIYYKRGFIEAKERTYENQMYFRNRHALFTGKHFTHLGHFFLDKTSRYGHSFGRWGITVLVFISLFAGVYAWIDWLSVKSMFATYANPSGFFDYFYFSLVTFTTLGYGDIVPVTVLEKVVSGLEVLLGFIMLGVFINLIQRKL